MILMRRILILLAALGFLPAAAPEPQDARGWAEALGYYQRCSTSKDPTERKQAAETLGNSTFEKHDKMCWQLVSAILRAELAKEGASGKTEEKISGDVLEGCLRAYRKIKAKDAVAEMTKVAKAKGEAVRVRAYAIWGLLDSGDLKDLTELVEDKSPMVQIAAMDCLADRADAGSNALFLRVLSENRTWEVKWLALKGLEKGGDEKIVEPLIESLAKCRSDEGRLKDQYIRILKKLLDVDIETDDPNAWKSVWTAKKSGTDLAPGATVVDPTQFYGLKTRSTRLIFVLDRTGSMAEPGSEPERPPYKLPPEATGAGEKEPPQEKLSRDECARIIKKWSGVVAKTRIDVAKKELIHTIYVLSPRVHFNVVWYESTPSPWKQELVPANWVNKLDAIQAADKITASGGTNIWDALEISFKMLELQGKGAVNPVTLDKKANYATSTGGVDTMFLMTDGRPNTGRIDKPEDILTELKKVNQLRKVTIHTICVGEAPPGAQPLDFPDPAFLKKIADLNGGEFVHIKK